MGAGFAVYVPEVDAARVVTVAAEHGLAAWVAGRVESGTPEVVLPSCNVRFAGDSLGVRA